MKWVYVILSTLITYAVLMYFYDKRLSTTQPLTTQSKVSVLFFTFLIFMGIFFMFDGNVDEQYGGTQSSSFKQPESVRVRSIREDCYDGLPPF